MIDIDLYRIRIGTFSPKKGNKKTILSSFDNVPDDKSVVKILSGLQFILKIILIISFLPVWYTDVNLGKQTLDTGDPPVQHALGHQHLGVDSPLPRLIRTFSDQLKPNFQARYKYGNISKIKGLKNIHLNIRSLAQKMTEVKNIIQEQKPHIFGLSECELKKIDGNFDEEKLKVPGYELLFPQSWSHHGFARAVMYVKKSLKFEQVHHLQDHLIQSVWIKTGFRNSTDIYFCHFYREHTSTLGASIAAQREQLGRFLLQWEEATTLNNTNDTNEVHISGDMNLDSLNGKWLRPDYNLVTLSRLVETACNVSNYSQLVAVPTRFQYNRVREVTDYSCIDHVYANKKHRCSDIVVTPYGGSDHDIVGYTRFSKVPPEPSRTIRKRSYKDFILEDFLRDVGEVDWSEVYKCQDVDISTEILTRKIVDILNIHAPWVVFQKRKYYAPWITKETKELIKSRDDWKRISEENTKIGNVQAAAEAWSKFKQIRNKVNNRKKVEEVIKSEKLARFSCTDLEHCQVFHDLENVWWSTTPTFYWWQDDH